MLMLMLPVRYSVRTSRCRTRRSRSRTCPSRSPTRGTSATRATTRATRATAATRPRDGTSAPHESRSTTRCASIFAPALSRRRPISRNWSRCKRDFWERPTKLTKHWNRVDRPQRFHTSLWKLDVFLRDFLFYLLYSASIWPLLDSSTYWYLFFRKQSYITLAGIYKYILSTGLVMAKDR